MPETPGFLARRLQSEGLKVLEFFRELTPEQWELPAYSGAGVRSDPSVLVEEAISDETAGWRVRQVLAHFVASEASIVRLIENITSGGPGAPEDFDLDRFNQRKVSQLERNTAVELLDQFTRLRHSTTDLVNGLTVEDLARTGRHPFLGVTTLSEIVKMIYRHNQIHMRELRRVLQP